MATGSKLTHLDSEGRARMVDVGDKPHSERTARAEARLLASSETLDLVRTGQAKKGAAYSDDRDDYVKEDRYSELRVGDRVVLDGDEYVVIKAGETVVLRRNDTIYRLPRIDDGSDYVRVGNVIVKVDRKTKAVFELIELADLILS